MGNPLAPPLAHLFMEKIENRALELGIQASQRVRFQPLTWFRYVDDVYCRLSHADADMIPQILDFLNSVHPKIQFTVEMESEDRILPFLEVSVKRQLGQAGPGH